MLCDGKEQMFLNCLHSIGNKVKVKQSRYKARGHRMFQEVKFPRFMTTAQDSG
jgi:hypothetical protein